MRTHHSQPEAAFLQASRAVSVLHACKDQCVLLQSKHQTRCCDGAPSEGGWVGGNVSASGARRASFWTRAPLVAF